MVQKPQWPIWENIRLILLGPGFISHQSFSQLLKFLTNLTNLATLLSRNLGKTQMMFSQMKPMNCSKRDDNDNPTLFEIYHNSLNLG